MDWFFGCLSSIFSTIKNFVFKSLYEQKRVYPTQEEKLIINATRVLNTSEVLSKVPTMDNIVQRTNYKQSNVQRTNYKKSVEDKKYEEIVKDWMS